MFERIPATVRLGVTFLLIGVAINIFVSEEAAQYYWSYDENRVSSIGILFAITGISF
jgi:hypothetical protein